MTDRTIVKIGGAALLSVLMVAILFALSVAAGGSRESLDGEWAGEPNEGLIFEATIDGDSFEVYMVSDGVSSLYWKGDLPIGDGVENGDVLYSEADQEALAFSLIGSQLEEKEFYFADDNIVFDFGILGTTREVVLSEQ